MTFDVAIIGAGPSGCMAAIAAKQSNPSLRVAIFDKNETPAHRIGEALLTGTVMALDELGIADQIAASGYHEKIGASYVWGKSRDPWYVNYPTTTDPYPQSFMRDGMRRSIHVPRHIFDAQLRDIASAHGVEFVFARLNDVVCSSGHVLRVMSDDGDVYRSAQWIDSTGQNALFGRRLTERRPILSSRVARYGYFDDLDWSRAQDAGFDPHRTNIISYEGGWCWVIHLGDKGGGLTSVGCVTTPDFAKRIDVDFASHGFGALNDFGFDRGLRLRRHDGSLSDALYAHPDYSFESLDLHGSNWSMSGDAALFLDPILSQGVTLAMHYGLLRGRAAVATLAGDDNAQAEVTRHYRNEAKVLRTVIGEWYSNNRSVDGWRLTAQGIAEDLGLEVGGDKVKSFMSITNLENLRAEYDPFPKSVTEHIWRHLK